jgi:membrane protein implicated in regulation of membrane protease activity
MEIVYWHWFILSVALFVIEILAPGVFFMWIGIGALIPGVVSWIFPTLPFEVTGALFAVCSVASLYLGRKYVRLAGNDAASELNQRGDKYIGRVCTLIEPVANGRSRVDIDGTLWLVHLEESLPKGAKITITGRDGAALLGAKA